MLITPMPWCCLTPKPRASYEVVLGELLTETDFRGEAAELPIQGGQLRYRRQVRDDTQRHYEEVAAYVAAYGTERPETHLILSGKDEILAHFRQLLPSHAQRQIIDTVFWDQRDTRDRILHVARERLEQHERIEEQETVRLLFDSAARGGPQAGHEQRRPAARLALSGLRLHWERRADPATVHRL